MKKNIIDVLDFANGIIVFFGSLIGISIAISKLFHIELAYCMIPSILCFGRFIYKIGGNNENNET